jgi:hypothetical protein
MGGLGLSPAVATSCAAFVGSVYQCLSSLNDRQSNWPSCVRNAFTIADSAEGESSFMGHIREAVNQATLRCETAAAAVQNLEAFGFNKHLLLKGAKLEELVLLPDLRDAAMEKLPLIQKQVTTCYQLSSLARVSASVADSAVHSTRLLEVNRWGSGAFLSVIPTPWDRTLRLEPQDFTENVKVRLGLELT